MVKRISLLVFLTLLLGKLSAQDEVYLEGFVIDSSNQKPLVAVNIFSLESNEGTFSEPDGRFKIKLTQLPTTLVFSFLGYENHLIKIKEKPTETLVIQLQTNALNLPGAEVIATPKVEDITSPSFSVKDFIIENDKILLVKYGGIFIGNFLELRDLDGVVLHSMPVKSKGIIESLYQSCLGNIHLIGTKDVVEVEISSGEIVLVSKYPKYQFELLLKPCIESSEDFVYFKMERKMGQMVLYDFISKKNNKVEESVYIVDELNLERMFYEFRHLNFSENHFSITKSFYGSTDIARPEEFESWQTLFYQPLFSPLYNIGEEICIFNHTLGFLQFYTLDGKFKRQFPINYHKERKWDQRIIKDKKRNKFYTVYNRNSEKDFYEINLKDGTISPAFKAETTFVEKMVIYDGYLYYHDSGTVPEDMNRVLHKVKVF